MSASNTTPEAIPGRWAISGTGLSNAILLDTATGETWHAGADGIWVRMLKAEDSPTGSFKALQLMTERAHEERMRREYP